MVWRHLKEAGASGTALWQSLGRITGLPKSRNLTLGVALDDARLTLVFGDFGRNQDECALKEREVNQFYRAIAALREVARGKLLEPMGIKNYGAEEGTRTPTPLRAHGPEPCASANSATSARCGARRSAQLRGWHLRFLQSARNAVKPRPAVQVLRASSAFFRPQPAGCTLVRVGFVDSAADSTRWVTLLKFRSMLVPSCAPWPTI